MIDLYLINTNMYIYNLSLFYLKVSYLYFVFKVYIIALYIVDYTFLEIFILVLKNALECVYILTRKSNL